MYRGFRWRQRLELRQFALQTAFNLTMLAGKDTSLEVIIDDTITTFESLCGFEDDDV